MNTGKSRLAPLTAFAAVYVIWGSTYLAIRVALETMPPFLMAAARFLAAGAVLYSWSRRSGRAPAPTRSEWRTATIVGGLLLLGGNGGVVWAEQYVPSGMAALLVATVPLFMVLLEWRWNGGDPPGRRVLGGILLGFAGVLLLVGASEAMPGARGLLPAAVVLLAAFSWATGSIYARRAPQPTTPRLGTAMQMLTGGLMLGVLGVLMGEPGQLELSRISSRSWMALAYLIVFGSLVAFSAYVWLLRESTPARVSTYAYVNPAVALFLGWSLAGEPLTGRILVGSAVILASVVLVTSRGPRRVPQAALKGAPVVAAANSRARG